MPATAVLKLRLSRDDPAPPSGGDDGAMRFGVQDNRGDLLSGEQRADGMYQFDFDIRIVIGADEAQPPIFLGPFVFGRPQDRFVYLSWRRDGAEADYVNRIKARLADIDWPLVHAARESGGRLAADLSGRKAGGGKLAVRWSLVDVPEPDHDPDPGAEAAAF